MNSPPPSPANISVSALVVGAVLGAVAAAWLNTVSFAGYVSAALAAAVFAALADSGPVMRIAATACAVSFPILVVLAGETGLLWGPAITLVILATASVLRGLRPGLVSSLALSLFVVIYIASLGSHLILIKEFRSGGQMVTAFFLMVGAFQAAAALVGALRRGRTAGEAGRHGAWLDWRAVIAGALACEGVAMGARSLIGLPLEVTAALIVGLVVAAAASLGNAVGGLVAESLPERVRERDVTALRHLNAVLLAAPSFYYGFSFYLS